MQVTSIVPFGVAGSVVIPNITSPVPEVSKGRENLYFPPRAEHSKHKSLADILKGAVTLKIESIDGKSRQALYDRGIQNLTHDEDDNWGLSLSAVANMKHNRYSNILPFDSNIYAPKMDGWDDYYLNASKVEIPGAKSSFVATQGPLASSRKTIATINEFWKAVIAGDTNKVVCLVMKVEAGRDKCADYWKIDKYEITDNKGAVLGSIHLTGESEVGDEAGKHLSANSDQYVLRRTFEYVPSKVGGTQPPSRKIIHYHYQNWPDRGVPEPRAFQVLQNAVREVESTGPILAHCSAGIGRTGTFIATSLISEFVAEALKDHSPEEIFIDIEEVILKMREQRAGLVQSQGQLDAIINSLRDRFLK